eukprot:GFUD01045029.1.p1 GENE.GFUD01045029.1~~GFUD01045029.1.p1  ORF type:complete len:719 (+),score=198.19 GFUD01045029.1:60-2216(+)
MADPDPPNNILSDIVSQTSLVPGMVERYRCMVVWDTRTNSDVGWLVVRKPEVEGLTSEEVETKMSKSQWRSWNQNKREENSEEEIQMNDSRISNGNVNNRNEVFAVNGNKNSDEASTSKEAKKGSSAVVTVDCDVQVKEAFIPQENYFDTRTCMEENTTDQSQEVKMAENESSVFDHVEVIQERNSLAEKNVIVPTFTDIASFVSEGQLDKEEKESKKVKTVNKIKSKREEWKTNKKCKKIMQSKSEEEEKSGEEEKVIKNVETGCEMFSDCPSDDKTVKVKSSTKHLKLVHRVKPAMTKCNVCRRQMAKSNLLHHRKLFHPERFKSDKINCSGCSTLLRAVDFDSHECGLGAGDEATEEQGCVEEDNERSRANNSKKSPQLPKINLFYDDEKSRADILKKSPKLPNLDNDLDQTNHLVKNDARRDGEVCGECCLVFAGDDIKHHDCRSRCFVRINRLDMKPAKSEDKNRNKPDQAWNGGGFIHCKECGEMFETNELLNQHNCVSVNMDSLRKVAEVEKLETAVRFTSIRLMEQPPDWLQRGEVFQFTIQLLASRNSFLQIQSVCRTACSTGLQYRVQLLQADGSSTLQLLWVYMCSTGQKNTRPAVLQNCLVPQQFVCRQAGIDMLQLCMSCEQHCSSKDCRFKLVVGTEKVVLCHSKELFVHNNGQVGVDRSARGQGREDLKFPKQKMKPMKLLVEKTAEWILNPVNIMTAGSEME